MSLLDIPKLALKARKMQSQMQSTKAVGKSGVMALIINGVYSIVKDEPDYEELMKRFPTIPEKDLRALVSLVMKDTAKAVEDAKTQLQKELAANINQDDLKGFLN